MGLPRGWRRSAAILPLLLGLGADTGCYDTGDGSDPPLGSFYFPVGLSVSHGGTALYAVNSNFDLQFNGGTIQSYDLWRIRQTALDTIAWTSDPERSPCARGEVKQPLGQTCAPVVDARTFHRDAVVIGAFATDLLLSRLQSELAEGAVKVHADDPPSPFNTYPNDRLFVPVRGNATLTWASVARDDFDSIPPDNGDYAPFHLTCGQNNQTRRCDDAHQVGGNALFQNGNTRHLQMPGEPFGAAFSEDGTSIVITHQNSANSTLFSTGLTRTSDNHVPEIKFVVDKVPIGGVGLAAVPHDPDAFLGAPSLPNAAFLETSRANAAVSLLRRYPDDGGSVVPSMPRPFLAVERTFPITATPSAVDSRGIVIDPTPRLACKARVAPVGPGQTVEDRDRQIQACARKPARAFIANRAPASLLVGDVGSVGTAARSTTTYDADQLTIHTAVPLPVGPSNVYLAPIVDRDGAYALRVFVVCFDAATIFVYDPDAGAMENVIHVAPGPFAMAFDPFSFDDVARHVQVPVDPRGATIDHPELHRYRFGYLASFTQSFMQVIDLDNAASPATFERAVLAVGQPTVPKGS